MTGIELFILLVGPVITLLWGEHVGYTKGYREGRMAVRKYYEKVGK